MRLSLGARYADEMGMLESSIGELQSRFSTRLPTRQMAISECNLDN